MMSEGDSAFWQFSLRFYRRSEVAAHCIDLQDTHDVDVNLLFFIFFLAIHQRQLSSDDVRAIDAYVSAWRKRVVQPLRAIRRELKNGIAPIDAQTAQDLRRAIQRDELQAERLQQELLERAFPAHSTGTMAAPRTAAAANIAAYSVLTGSLPAAAVDTLLASLAEEFSV